MLNEVKNHIPSSIVMFFVAVQLCLGIALASGVPLFSWGIAGIVVNIASGSPLGISGPTVGLVVISQLIVGDGFEKKYQN